MSDVILMLYLTGLGVWLHMRTSRKLDLLKQELKLKIQKEKDQWFV